MYENSLLISTQRLLASKIKHIRLTSRDSSWFLEYILLYTVSIRWHLNDFAIIFSLQHQAYLGKWSQIKNLHVLIRNPLVFFDCILFYTLPNDSKTTLLSLNFNQTSVEIVRYTLTQQINPTTTVSEFWRKLSIKIKLCAVTNRCKDSKENIY